MPDPRLEAAARAVLRANDAGRWTVPSRTQYPHQWNWDSAFISLGLATFDWDRAVMEIESMLATRWREGMVPHVRYDPAHVPDYFPGPDRWLAAQTHVAQSGVPTSGITNPPVLVSAAFLLGQRQPARERRLVFWRKAFPALCGFVGYLSRDRRLPEAPLVAMVHPWESGWDNSPRWDHLLAAGLRPSRHLSRLDTHHVAAADRPTDADYVAYLALIGLLEAADYDLSAFRASSPFCVYDVLMDALWHRAARDLNEIARELGEPQPVPEGCLTEFAAAFEEYHWDADLGLYVDWDCVSGRRISRPTAAGLAALAGGLASRDHAREAWQRYRKLQAGARAVCTVPPADPAFDARRYWRGPVWAHVNWLVADGLERCGLDGEAAELRQETLDLIRQSGFAEYFDPITGAACGADAFSWTAALTLELLSHELSD